MMIWRQWCLRRLRAVVSISPHHVRQMKYTRPVVDVVSGVEVVDHGVGPSPAHHLLRWPLCITAHIIGPSGLFKTSDGAGLEGLKYHSRR